MNPVEQQLQELTQHNRTLRIQLEATREAGIQALRSASQKLHEAYRIRWEELKKSHKDEKERIQDGHKGWERKLEEEEEKRKALEELWGQRCARTAAMEERLKRMEEEKQTLLEKKTNSELLLRDDDALRRSPVIGPDLPTLQDQLRHLQLQIQSRHRSLHCSIQEAEELKRKSARQDGSIEELKGRLRRLEEENKELKARLTARLGQSAGRVSKGVGTERFPPIGRLKVEGRYRVFKLDQSGSDVEP